MFTNNFQFNLAKKALNVTKMPKHKFGKITKNKLEDKKE